MSKNFTKQFFFRSITVIFVLVFGVFLFGNITNASTNTTTDKLISLNGDLYVNRGTSFGGVRFDDITEEDGTLVCYVAEHKTSKPYTMTYNPASGDDISMTAFQHNAEFSWGWNNAIFYLVDVPSGDFGIDLNTTGVVSCVWVASNVLEGEFIDYTNPGVGDFNTFSTTTDATTLVLHFADNPWGSYTWWNDDYTDLMLFSRDIYYHHGENNAFNIFGFDSATPPEQFSDIQWGSESFTITLDRKSQANGTIFYSTLLFDSPDEEPLTDDYVMYYGDNPSYTPVASNFNLQFAFNVCENYNASTTSAYYAELTPTSTFPLVNQVDLFSCSGTSLISDFAPVVESAGTSTIRIYNQNNELIVESNGWINGVYTPLESIDNWINFYFDVPFYINTATGSPATTTLDFTYRITDTLTASSSICLKNSQTGIKTDYCFTPTGPISNGTIDISNTVLDNYYFIGSFTYYDSNGTEQLSSNDFALAFYDNTVIIDEPDIESQNKFFNVGKKWWKIFKNIFPFNFPVAILTAWNNSETARLTPDLQFLDMSEDDGSLLGHIPSEWTGSATDTEFILFGEDLIANGSLDATDLFANFKKFTKWLQYFAFSFGVFALARKLIADLTEKQSDNI